jgi:predicted helicase
VKLLATKAVRDPQYQHVFVTNTLSEAIYISGTTATNAMNFPLYLYTDSGEKVPNLALELVARIEETAGTTTPEDILDYVYAYLHAPLYRAQYGEFLKADFPRVPYPTSKAQFWKLVSLGTTLRGLHLLTDSAVSRSPVSFPVSGTNVVEKVALDGTRVYINAMQYFDGVPKDVWGFYIGGYQPAQKYLKDRKGRTLTNAEFEQYEKIIASLMETIRVMAEVDAVVRELIMKENR